MVIYQRKLEVFYLVGPYERSVKHFLKAADHLTELDEPMVVHLRTLARQMDSQLETEGEIDKQTAAIFGVTWGRLTKPVQNKKKELESDPDLQFS